MSDVKVVISADEKPLKEAFDRATKHIDNFSKNASEAINKASGYVGTMSNMFAGGVTPAIQETDNAIKQASASVNTFTQTALGVAVGQFAFESLRRSIQFVKDTVGESIDAFAEQEDAINKLKQSFILTGGASDSAVDGVNAFASSLEASSRFSDDAIIKQVAFVKSLGASTQASKDLVLAAANLSATIGGSLEENTDKLGKTLSGTTGRLAQYIPELNSLTLAQLKAGDAAKIINEKFGGSAANDLKTYAGSVDALKNSYNNLQESIGEVIIKSGPIESAISFAKRKIDEFNTSIAASKITVESASGGYAVASKTAEQLGLEHAALGREIDSLKQKLEGKTKPESFFGFLASDPMDLLRLKKLEELTAVRDQIDEKLRSQKISTPKEAVDAPAKEVRSRESIDNELKIKAEISDINRQFEIEQEAFKDQAFALSQQNEFARKDLEIQATFESEAKKLESVTQAELAKTKFIQDEHEKRATREKIVADNQLKAIKIQNTKELAEKQNMLAIQKKNDQGMLDATGNFIQAGILLAKDGSAVQKGLMITQAVVNTYAGATRAFVDFPFPASAAVAGSIVALGLANVAKISGAKFEQGGVVPGLNQFGDNVQVRVNPGEVILNNSQQKELLDVANGRSNNNDSGMLAALVDALRNQPIILQMNDRELGRGIRDLRASGYAV